MDTEQFECLAAQALVGRYLTGDDLPPESQAELEGHLETCSDCRDLLAKKKAELLLALQTDSVEPSPATPEPEIEREIPTATTPEKPVESAEPATAELTPAQISAMMNPAPAVPDGIELVFDEEELPTASPEPVAEAPAPAVAAPTPVAAKETDDILKSGLDEDLLDDLLGNMPEPYVPPAPDPELVAAMEAAETEAAANLATPAPEPETETEKEKPKIRVRVEGLPILLGKNLKTLAYSASLGLVLVAMTSFAKNPSTVFGERAIAAKTDAHADKEKPHDTPVKDGHAAEEKKPPVDEHKPVEKPVGEHAAEPEKVDEHSEPETHSEPKPDEHAEPTKEAIHQRMKKFETEAERDARIKKATEEHADEPTTKKHSPTPTKKTDSHASPRVSEPNSYMVARPSGSTTAHAKADEHRPKPKATTIPKPKTRVTKSARTKKPTTSHTAAKPVKRSAPKPAAKKPAKPTGLKIYDEHGNPIN